MPDGPIRSVRVLVTGRVQGVGFRQWVKRTALDLGLDGTVFNRRDGRVEALIAGSPEAIQRMVELMNDGPPAADVDGVAIIAEGEPAPRGFHIERTE